MVLARRWTVILLNANEVYHIVGNLSRKRANLSSSHELEGTCRIEAQVPLAEMLDYANEIRSLTQGKGSFTMTPNGYEAMPKRISDRVLKRDAA